MEIAFYPLYIANISSESNETDYVLLPLWVFLKHKLIPTFTDCSFWGNTYLHHHFEIHMDCAVDRNVTQALTVTSF